MEVALIIGTSLTAFATVALAIGTLQLARESGTMAKASQEAARENRRMVEVNREMVEEMREARIAQDQPQIIVDADYSKPPLVYVVVRNIDSIGKGAAKNISFEFSAPMAIPEGANNPQIVSVNEQPYFKQGMDYMAPGAEISTLWGSMPTLAPFLRKRQLHDGVTIASRYESIIGELYETGWTVNPLLIASRISIRRKGIHEIAEATERISEYFDR